MKKIILLLFISLINTTLFSQEDESSSEAKKDSITYHKNVNYKKEREFKEELKSKYSDHNFIYKEEEKKKEIEEIKEKKEPLFKPNFNFFRGFASFMKTIFPFLLGAIVIFIILKLYLGSNAKFWNLNRTSKVNAKKLVYEDEDIDNSDIEGLLKKAIAEKNTRLAIRYYYLLSLKKLSEKEIIKYDKDKTNSDYLFEIEDIEKRKQFSYLSYIYTYVWYGEFELNQDDFSEVAKKYNTFYKTII